MKKQTLHTSFFLSRIVLLTILFGVSTYLWFHFNLSNYIVRHKSISVAQAQTVPPEVPWPMAGGNPQRTSWTSAGVDPSQLSPSWYATIDAYIPPRFQIVAGNNTAFVATTKGLYAFNVADGTKKWQFYTSMPPGNSPTYVNSTSGKVVYLAGHDRKLHVLNADTGSELWNFEVGNPPSSLAADEFPSGFDTSPLVVGDKVYLGNDNGYVYAIYSNDSSNKGQIAWKYKTEGQVRFSPAHSAASGTPTVYVVSNDAYAYALNAGSGGLIWKSVKIPVGDGFNSWWPVVYSDPTRGINKLILSGSRAYRMVFGPQLGNNSGNEILTKYDEVAMEIKNGQQVTYPAYSSPISGIPTDADRRVNMSGGLTYFSNTTNSANPPWDKFSWRQIYYFFDLSTGIPESPTYAPLMNMGTNSGPRAPAIVGADHTPGSSLINEVYTFNDYTDKYANGAAGWKPGNNWITAAPAGESAGDEPLGYAASGTFIYWNQCCDRYLGWYDTQHPGNNGRFARGSSFGGDYAKYTSGTDGANPSIVFGSSSGGGFNGSYGYSGDQDAPIPYVSTNNTKYIFVHRANAVLAYSSSPNSPVKHTDITASQISPPAFSAPVTDQNVLKQKLTLEVQKMISAGHLRPGWGVVGNFAWFASQMGSNLADYWSNPADTIYALSIAYPYVSSSVQPQLRTYLQNEMRDYSPCDYNFTGYATGASREDFTWPPEIAQASKSGPSGGKAPFAYYAAWQYAKIFGINDSYVSSCRSSPPTLSGASSTSDAAYKVNIDLADLMGYMQMQVMAGQISSINQSSVYSSYQSLINSRVGSFQKDNPWGGPDAGSNGVGDDKQAMAVSRNFLYLTPEVGQDLLKISGASTKFQNAFNEYNYVAPFWFNTKFEAAYGETGYQLLYDYSAMFLAKAYLLSAPKEELSKYLDAPAVARGDLFFIQNLVAAIEAPASLPPPTPGPSPSPGVSPTPAPTPLPGDINGDHTVNTADLKLVLTNFIGSTVCSTFNCDVSGDGKVNLLDAAYVIRYFGQTW